MLILNAKYNMQLNMYFNVYKMYVLLKYVNYLQIVVTANKKPPNYGGFFHCEYNKPNL